jgi:hypothetical protein
MADPIKKSAVPAHSVSSNHIIFDVVIILLVFFLMYVANNITPITIKTLSSGEVTTTLIAVLEGRVDIEFLKDFFISIKNILAVLGVVFLGGTFLLSIKIRQKEAEEHKKYEPIHLEEIEAKAHSIKWQVILNHVNSENSAEWKIAIIEADSMLDEILDKEGYGGNTVAEKLKMMSSRRLASYDDAWEAHKFRNEIAHSGSEEVDISKKIARDTIAKFENAFHELGYL